MTSLILQKLQVFLRILVSLGLIFYMLYEFDRSSLPKAEPRYLILLIVALFVMILGFASMSARMWWLLRLLKAKVSYWQCLHAYFMGTFWGTFLPTSVGGDVFRASVVRKVTQLGWSGAGRVVVAERLIGLSALGSLLFLGVIGIDRDLFVSKYLIAATGMIMTAAAMVASWIVLARYQKLSLMQCFQLWTLSLLGQCGEWGVIYIFSYYVEPVDPLVLFFVMSLTHLATLLPISFGGLGLREMSIVSILSYFEYSHSNSVFLASSLFLIRLFCAMIGGLCYARKGRGYNQKLRQQSI